MNSITKRLLYLWGTVVSAWPLGHSLAECDVPVPGIPGTGIFLFVWWYRNWYRNKLVLEKSLGTGIGQIWNRKKVSEPVSGKFGTVKSTGIGIENI